MQPTIKQVAIFIWHWAVFLFICFAAFVFNCKFFLVFYFVCKILKCSCKSNYNIVCMISLNLKYKNTQRKNCVKKWNRCDTNRKLHGAVDEVFFFFEVDYDSIYNRSSAFMTEVMMTKRCIHSHYMDIKV